MIVRSSFASSLRFGGRPSARLLLVLVALVLTAGCKKKPKPFPPAPQLSSTATTEGAALGPLDAGVIPVQVMTATPSSLPTPVETMTPADRTAFDQTTAAVRDLEAQVKRGALTNDADAASKCASIEEARSRLEALPDPDSKKLVADSKRLCSLEVPILSADHALKQVTISPSQASRQLMCKYASKDIDKARGAKRDDRRVRDLEARFSRSCR